MVVNIPWIQVAGWEISYFLGIDGLSILLVLLTTFLTPISILSTWTAVEERVKEFMLFFLLLEVGMVGVFLSLDLFLFYLFWEFTLVPMYFLIGVWGGPNRVYAAVKFFLYTMAGSVLMLLGILTPTAGTASVLGMDSRTQSIDIRSVVGYMPEGDCLPTAQTAADFMIYAAELARRLRAVDYYISKQIEQ